MSERMRVIPLDLDEANALVERWHRHHDPVRGHKFSIGVSIGEVIHGCAIVGRPVSRFEQAGGLTLEVNRCATDGTRNACSMLYRAAWRVVSAMGYLRLITYTLPEEGGASLRGAGFKLLGKAGGGSWNRESRPRVDMAPTQEKFKWEVST